MSDLDERLRAADRVDAPDLWDRIEARAREKPSPRASHLVTIVVCLVTSAAAIGGVVVAFSGTSAPPAGDTPEVFLYSGVGPAPQAIPFDNHDLFALDPATGERYNLTSTPTVAETSPVWTADGSMVVYRRAVARGEGETFRVTHDIVVAETTGLDPVTIVDCPDQCSIFDMAWSPEGSRLAWTDEVVVDGGSRIGVLIHDLRTGETEVLCDSRTCGQPGQPVWSPDGTRLAFSNAGSVRFTGPLLPSGPIWVADLEGETVSTLTHFDGSCDRGTGHECAFDSSPAWSPDGSSIAFVRTVNLGMPGSTTSVMTVGADGSGERQLSVCRSQDQCTQRSLAWSPDGRLIAFFERYRPMSLSLIDTANREIVEVPLRADVGTVPSSLQWSPDGSEVAFVGGPARQANLYVAEAGARTIKLLAEDVAAESELSWVPEGAVDLSRAQLLTPPTQPSTGAHPPAGTIAFSSSNGSVREDSGTEIWTITTGGADLTRLTRNETYDVDPAFSPDGRRIAFATFRGGRDTQIFVMNTDGTDQVILTDIRFGATQPAWSPDGSRIAFASSGGIFVADAGGSDPVLVAEATASDPSWSPDGSRIAFTRSDDNGDGNLAVVDVATGEVTELGPELPGSQDEPAWSPDGDEVAFQWHSSAGSGLYVMPLGGQPRKVAVGSAPVWSPDGEWIAFTHFDDQTGPQIWLVTRDGTDARAVTSMVPFLEGTGIAGITDDPSWTAAG